MPPLRLKLKETVQKWRTMVKRRIHPEDDTSESHPGSKQQRTMTGKMTGKSLGTSQHSLTASTLEPSSSSLPAQFLIASTMIDPSSSATGAMDNPKSHGIGETFEANTGRGSAADPIDLTESSLGSGSCIADPIDLTAELVRTESTLPNLCPQTLALSISDGVHIDKEKTAQTETNQPAAQDLQRHLQQNELELLKSKHSHQFSFKGDPLEEYRRLLQATKCAHCKTPLKFEISELIERTKKLLKDSRFFHPYICCQGCKKFTCVGGDKYYEPNFMPLLLKNVSSAKGLKSTWCCDQGRLFLIFCLLCGPESTVQSPADEKQSPHRKLDPSSGKSVWRQSQLSKGTGYGDDIPRREKKDAQSQARQGGNDNTEILEFYFLALVTLWPFGADYTAASDNFSQRAISAMLPRSPVLQQHVAELLRYAAIQEINVRRGPIIAVLDFLERVGENADTSQLLLGPRTLFPPTEQLAQVVLGNTKNRRAPGTTAYETAQPLGAILEHLAISCRKFVETSRRYGKLLAEDDQALFTVVRRICDIADGAGSLRVQLAVKKSQEPSKPLTSFFRRRSTNVTTRAMRAAAARDAENMVVEDIAKRVSEWHRANCVREISDDTMLSSSHFLKEARAAEKLKPAAGRMRKLLAQVSSLSTDLPDGIYVRHGESRVDVLKFLVIGPAGTPYEHGVFEFDMFCDSDFPKTPPRVFFRTTGGGKVTFNPNLYSNGKVCLSLLGTWHGQPWEPDHSTILQILVSIQAMIFNDEPFYNEPGYEYRSNPLLVQEYNRNVEYQTVEHAMVTWLSERLANPDAEVAGASSLPIPTANQPKRGTAGEALNPTSLAAGAANPASTPNPMLSTTEMLMQLYQGDLALAIYADPSHVTPTQPLTREDDPIWGDVVRNHFELKTKFILATVQKWEKEATTGRTAGNMAAAAQKLEQLLRRHRFHD